MRPPNLPSDDPDDTSMLAVLQTHAPTIARARQGFFEPLANAVDSSPRRAELLRLRAAELTGCTLCRNLRMQGARDAGVDEAVIEAMRDGDHDVFDAGDRAALALGDAFCGHQDDQAMAGVRDALGARESALLVLSLVKAVAFGKVVVALGLEPEHPTLTVVG